MRLILVTYQLPNDIIVGVYKNKKTANEHYDLISDIHAPLIYECDIDGIKNQSGYDENRTYIDGVISRYKNSELLKKIRLLKKII